MNVNDFLSINGYSGSYTLYYSIKFNVVNIGGAQ